MTAVLQVRDLKVSFRQDGRDIPAVKGVSFDVNRGETVALVGESGSGKSVTALSTVSLLGDNATLSGSITYDGTEMIGASERDLMRVRGNDISFIFQEPMTSLNPLHTLERQLTESLSLHQGLIGDSARARVLELMHKVGIRDPETRLGAYPHQLSGGQRQRVMIAMALANGPDCRKWTHRRDFRQPPTSLYPQTSGRRANRHRRSRSKRCHRNSEHRQTAHLVPDTGRFFAPDCRAYQSRQQRNAFGPHR
ncbi:MAG: ABC-type microcin C transport system duplicated ATPase subunit YejF [Paracoccaceae bacterium]|jgi:ABC-type microcin C transport system duplicated ATPase subunit YejF